MSSNTNWPNLRLLYASNANGTFDGNTIRYSDITWRMIHSWDVQRGRQYELDTMMAGTGTFTIHNDDEAFDPLNTTSPFAGGVLPERLVQLTASYPNTANLLTYDQATGGEQTPLSGTITDATIVSSQYASPTIVTTGAWQGTQAWQVVVPASPTTNEGILIVRCPVEAPSPWRAAKPYSFSVYIACLTTGQSPVVDCGINWFGPTGTYISTTAASTTTLTGNSTPTYVRVTVSATNVPTGAVTAEGFVSLTTSPTVATTYNLDGLQFEQNSAPTAFAAGLTYPIYTGNVERYPETYDLSGTRVTTPLMTTDPLALLAQTIQQASFNANVQYPQGPDTVGANFIYSLGDGTGASQFQDTTGNRVPANLNNSSTVPTGVNFIRTGAVPNDSTAATGWTSAPTQVPIGPQQGPILNTFLGLNQATYSYTVTEWIPPVIGSNAESEVTTIRFPPNSTTGIGGPPSTAFMRMLCFRVNPGSIASVATLWDAFGGSTGNINYRLQVYVGPSGAISFQVVSGGIVQTSFSAANVQDGNWHMAFFGIDPVANIFYWQLDNGSLATASSVSWAPGHFHIDDIGGTYFGDGSNTGVWAFKGQLMYAVEWPYILTSTQTTAVYNSWLTDYMGDSTDQRVNRILGWANYTGTRKLDTGYTPSLGPATDIDGNDAVTNLQNVVQTENGEHFYNTSGTYIFHNRARRYVTMSPAFVFGDSPGAGEIPYESCEFDFDTTNIDNEVQTTQVSTNVIAYSQTSNIPIVSASQNNYGIRSLNITNQSTKLQDCLDESNYLATVNSNARVRVATLRLHPASNPSVLWPVCLALELETYVQVNRRKGNYTKTVYGFVENIHWTADNTGDAVLELQISPAPGQGMGPSIGAYRPWNLAPMYGTIQAASSGQPTVTVNLPSGNINNTQTLAQQVYIGLVVIVGTGTANAEQKTVSSVGTNTITFTANLTNNHNSGEFLREISSVVTSSNYNLFDTWSTLGDGSTSFNNIQINY